MYLIGLWPDHLAPPACLAGFFFNILIDCIAVLGYKREQILKLQKHK